MKIEKLVVGQLQTNCYLVWDKESGEAIIIDPGDDGDFVTSRIGDLKINPRLVVATHGHFDHILGAAELKLAFGIPFLLHRADLPILKKAQNSANYWLGLKADPPPKVDKFIKEGDFLEFGKEKLKVIELPGHSPGGVGLYSKKAGILFSGDSLFCRGVGRTDFPYSSSGKLKESLRKLLKLPEKTLVYPGHGPETMIGEESRLDKGEITGYS